MMAVDTTIKTAYEVENMSPEEIAADQNLDLGAVKAKLMQISVKYRKDCGQEVEAEDRLNFSNDQLERVNEVIFNAALTAQHESGAPDYRTQLAAAIYIRDDKKGRKEVIKGVRDAGGFNMLLVNNLFAQARESANEIKEKIVKELVEK